MQAVKVLKSFLLFLALSMIVLPFFGGLGLMIAAIGAVLMKVGAWIALPGVWFGSAAYEPSLAHVAAAVLLTAVWWLFDLRSIAIRWFETPTPEPPQSSA